ncbi:MULTISPECIES: hypothetical protein [Corallococcus]|uniref:hypothetical protein n=1 Tax=Corallococcus TaxID=83461 RepID=UPI00118046C8|nr:MULTISPECIES: hypothetical protein [Corallococcus]NBD12307.1 hypothetical protein [Corallococcus silvisoli]TSC25260.1 hypothetical protein FOF48_25360 [Corallococcus sp. Z5C101001]
MGTFLAVVGLGVELVLAVALMGATFVALAFSGEAYRRGITLAHRAMNALSAVIAIVPLLLTLWVIWRRFFSSRPWGEVPLGLGLPLAVGLPCAAAVFLALLGGEALAGRAFESRRRKERRGLRAEVERGAVEKSCDLVVTDPAATPEDLRRCRTRIESLASPEARWREFLKFVDGRTGFRTWNPEELGLAPSWDWNRSVAVVRHEQEWFLPAFYETWLARSDAFLSEADLERLLGCLNRSRRSTGWSAAAIERLRPQLLPEIARRLDARQGLSGTGALWRDSAREVLAALQRTPEEGGGPPVPASPGTPAPDAIGLARLGEDGSLHLWLRATPTTGTVGDVYFNVFPHEKEFSQWMKHIGPLPPGEVRGVSPLRSR